MSFDTVFSLRNSICISRLWLRDFCFCCREVLMWCLVFFTKPLEWTDHSDAGIASGGPAKGRQWNRVQTERIHAFLAFLLKQNSNDHGEPCHDHYAAHQPTLSINVWRSRKVQIPWHCSPIMCDSLHFFLTSTTLILVVHAVADKDHKYLHFTWSKIREWKE